MPGGGVAEREHGERGVLQAAVADAVGLSEASIASPGRVESEVVEREPRQSDPQREAPE